MHRTTAEKPVSKLRLGNHATRRKIRLSLKKPRVAHLETLKSSLPDPREILKKVPTFNYKNVEVQAIPSNDILAAVKSKNIDPVDQLANLLGAEWGPPFQQKEVTWPLNIRVGIAS